MPAAAHLAAATVSLPSSAGGVDWMLSVAAFAALAALLAIGVLRSPIRARFDGLGRGAREGSAEDERRGRHDPRPLREEPLRRDEDRR